MTKPAFSGLRAMATVSKAIATAYHLSVQDDAPGIAEPVSVSEAEDAKTTAPSARP